MKNNIQYLPLTAFAVTIVLGGSLSAGEKASKDTSMKDEQGQSQMSARTADKTAKATTSDKANLYPMTASKVLGMNIDTADNEKIGEIDEVFIDSDTGEVLAMVVSTGGLLGMGQQQSLISPADLRFNADRTLMQTDITKDQIQSAPRYLTGETESFDNVRPLGKARANWDAREARAESRPVTGLGQKGFNRPTASEEHAEKRPAAGIVSTTADERTERTDPVKGVQSHSRGLAVSELIGMSVENREGETVGKVDQVFLDLENREVVGVVVSTGGFLGMGDRKTLFGVREMSFDPTSEKVLLDYNRDQIREFPEYKENEQSVFSALRKRTDRLDPRDSNRNARTAVDVDRTEARTVGRSSDMTVFDQGNSSDEIAMTAAIRTAIREDTALSNRANNVTIITKKGKVVLRGEVDSASDKTTVEAIAQQKAGPQNVISELVVASR